MLSVKIKNRTAFERRVAQWDPIIRQEMQKASERIAPTVADIVQAEAPVLTGRLAASVFWEPLDRTVGARTAIDADAFPPDEFYPAILHYGTDDMEPDRYMSRAAWQYRSGAKRDFGVHVKRWKRRITYRR